MLVQSSNRQLVLVEGFWSGARIWLSCQRQLCMRHGGPRARELDAALLNLYANHCILCIGLPHSSLVDVYCGWVLLGVVV